MANFFRKRSREKLYKQWVEKEGLSPEDIPEDLKRDRQLSTEIDENSVNDTSSPGEYRPRIGLQIESIFTSLSARLVLVMALIIVILLVALSVISTVLIMRGC